MSTEAFSETLRFITNVKLAELSKKNKNFSEHASRVFDEANSLTDVDAIARLKILVDGLRAWPGARTADFNLEDIERFLEQARRDPGFPPDVIDEWNRQANAQFNNEGTRFDFARLFGMLVNDWLMSNPLKSLDSSINTNDDSDVSRRQSSFPEEFENVSTKQTIEHKEALESVIFEEKKIDIAALESYLGGLFESKESKEELKKLRARIRKFASSLKERQISIGELKQVIQSVLCTDVLSEEKQETLKEFLLNPTITQELASVLNMQLSTIKSWTWREDGVALGPQRLLNGRTRFYLDAEILTCLLLHFLGLLWSVEFKQSLMQLLKSAAWKKPPKKLNRVDHIRRDVFYGKEDVNTDKLRRQFDTEHFFMCQLPSNFEIIVDQYEEDPGRGGNRFASLGSVLDDGPRFDTPIDLKQSLLHILSADIVLNREFHGQCTAVRTDFEWFGSSLAFDTITTVLRFFGVPEEDVAFMQAFLACPIKFKDDPSGQVRMRKRGVPLSYSFSTLFGELVMFIMDFAVNQKSDGLFLHRIHDDIWFCDPDETRCVTAWKEMQRYASIAGLTFNMEKTGSVTVGKDAVHEELPHGNIRWGFLVMDQTSNGRFKVDRGMIDRHVADLQRQLASTSSVFGWVQAYNKYMAFIVRNCGEPSIVYGKEHVDDIIDNLARIQKSLFAGKDGQGNGSFATAIAKMIKEKFDMSLEDVPLGWYLWPNAAGGLEIKDPLVDMFLLRDGYAGRSVDEIIRRAHSGDEREYSLAKKRWEDGGSIDRVEGYLKRSSKYDVVSSSDPFFSFEEFTKGREERGSWWHSAYKELLNRPKQCTVACTPRLKASLKLLDDSISAFEGATDGHTLLPYWQWIIALHHDAMVKKFGSLAVVDPATVPAGMVSVFKGSRMKWEQQK
ncbi:hypothetical protein A7U60_g462 [Sanghuangporus baumii]|uniref:Reverse transcriptase domain-containing protein n=1 Tax=Sanghuangporus baumii TaxID=108892 RepID=A0A9Q5I5P6_SANBA|nr:hypothetical protein A7U60_g462 [Sanghuangporus baumii]